MTQSYANIANELHTIIDFLRYTLSRANLEHLYYGHGTDNAWDDAWALILGSLALPLDVDSMLLASRLTENEKKYLCSQIERRIKDRVPVPYLTNQAYFCGLSFYVDERVLIPRSPIGELISQQFSPWIEEARVNKILDLCTGSGCIAIACAYAFPHATVDAVDISAEALQVAAMNCDMHAMQDTVNLIQSDCYQALPGEQYDLIVSNPPYVSLAEMQTLPKEYLHEPKLALEAAGNGLAIVEKILREAHHHLNDRGILVVEVGNSEEALTEAYPDLPFTWLEFELGGQGVFLLTKQQLKDYFE
ncbi:50S ribosomal protein L3 N(5)-glutamine methyltransferase [Legionella septentrionalis]|uniref:50S ribosomal protein L3 N(5)-glutamine methyltransferase n=1 Tax=Legionella septentrionalis TaxID=2498109 RepID=UPI000F8C9858|nr:50S ribosomal protein L3 N(5)-glutamine methyltransferase [Legionella septentrionalis]RUR17376.1 50S ribosomal protein L3 N(5)-glutamine methyltransferase [Legionella septentrionalis]